MKKILITNSHLKMGGIENSLVNLVNSIDHSKYEIDLFLIDKEGELLNKVSDKVNIYELNDFYKTNFMITKVLVRFPFLMKKFFKQNKKYDVAISYNGYNNITDMTSYYANCDKKIIWVHSDYLVRRKMSHVFKAQYLRMKFKYKYFDKIVCSSKGAMDSFNELEPNLASKTDYCYNIVKLKDNEQKSDDINLDGEINIVTLGRLVEQKGFDRFIEIIKKLRDSNYNVKGYIIGEGEKRDELTSLIKKNHLEDNVKLLGHISNPYGVLKKADVFLLTSYVEGFGIVLIEALSLGIPIVLPKFSSASEIHNNIAPKNSSIVTDNDIDSLFYGTKKMIDNLDNYKFNFELEKYNLEVLNKLDKILSGD